MFASGLRSISDVAALTPDDLTRKIKNINKNQAEAIVRAAKITLIEQLDTLKNDVYKMQKSVRNKVI